MANKPRNAGLHLPDLTIKGFRGADSLSIPSLGRVNLFTGKNGIGKTTVLEAVQVYASRGDGAVLSDLVRKREEIGSDGGEEGDRFEILNFPALFFGRNPDFESCIEIGPDDKSEKLLISLATAKDEEDYLRSRSGPLRGYPDRDLNLLKVQFKSKTRLVSGSANIEMQYRRIRTKSDGSGLQLAGKCQYLGPGILPNSTIARFWDQVALTEDENLAVDALNLVLEDKVDRITMVGDESSRYYRRRALARLGRNEPVPLKSLGDGAVRLFGAALAMANCSDGFLLIDEAENGIHHSVQHQFWAMILETASRNNIQVFATTHSFDCVKGFARAAIESGDAGLLFRLEKDADEMKCIPYSEEELGSAAHSNIEVR